MPKNSTENDVLLLVRNACSFKERPPVKGPHQNTYKQMSTILGVRFAGLDESPQAFFTGTKLDERERFLCSLQVFF
jgi:hypothetical protein